MGAGGVTPVGVVPEDDVVVTTRVVVGNDSPEIAVMQTGRCCFSARSLNNPSSQLDPTHGFQRLKSDIVIPASEAIFAQLGSTCGVNDAHLRNLVYLTLCTSCCDQSETLACVNSSRVRFVYVAIRAVAWTTIL